MKQKIILADLTHTAQGISSLCFPLGVSYVASYAKESLGEFYDFELSKFSEDLAQSFLDQPPVLLGLSCYSWNMELSLAFSRWAKKLAPDLVVVFGGPNFPTNASEKDDFLKQRPEIDFYLENEGEIGFVELINKLRDYGFSADALKKSGEIVGNCNYLYDGKLVEGEVQRILDINMIPSPYLTGMLDKFFKLPLEPMIETTRGCPFSCAFCADGMASKNRVVRYDHERTRDELDYIGEYIQQNKDIDALLLTDLNFGMYTQDYKTAEYIRGIQDKYGWPRVLKGSAGKNKPERVIEAVSLLKDSWLIGSAIQSSDKEVLANIKRSNISTDAYQKFIDYANKGGKNSQSYTEIILALPGDTKEKHLKSLRGGIENKVNTVKMYQAMLLFGTSMASLETRKEFQLLTKFRAMPGCVGVYKFGDEEVRVAEVEEIVVGSKDMPFEDYVACRVMNLLIEFYYNNALFAEVYSSLRAMDISPFDFLTFLFEHSELYTPRISEIFKSFVQATTEELYDSREAALAHARQKGLTEAYVSGKIGGNELLDHRAMLYQEFDGASSVLRCALKKFLSEKNILDAGVESYFEELVDFITCMKKDVFSASGEIKKSFVFDFVALEETGFDVDPRKIKKKDQKLEFKFYHDENQAEQIRAAMSLYQNHPGKLGRMIQRTNLKPMYRCFENI